MREVNGGHFVKCILYTISVMCIISRTWILDCVNAIQIREKRAMARGDPHSFCDESCEGFGGTE